MTKKWETVIGLEVHVELSTKSKIFCSCSTSSEGEPNTHCCPVCMGFPGSLPVLNEQVLYDAIMAGLALNCEIEKNTRFDRKNYFYPDLPKAYQISQLYKPIAYNGFVDVETDGVVKRIRIHEMHMEEDAGKLVHSNLRNETYPDYNRCGIPLLEIVSEPDFRSIKEVVAYLEKIRMLFSYLDIADFKTREGTMRADVNISIREFGAKSLGTRTEMKNINSVAAIERAIEYETSRQIDLLSNGKSVAQETRHWNDDQRLSYAMRSKENAQDYRYFPEPDIPPITLTDAMIEKAKSLLPEFMDEKKQRFVKQYAFSEVAAERLVANRALADCFEKLVQAGVETDIASNWVVEHFSRLMKKFNLGFENAELSPKELAKLINYVEQGKVNRTEGLKILEQMIAGLGPENVEAYINEKGLFVSTDNSELAIVIAETLKNNPKAVKEYQGGKEKVLGFLVGSVIKESKGKFNPSVVKEEMERALKNEN